MAGGVPDAPFKKNWPALAMKVAIQDAMERGATRLAWLGGQGTNQPLSNNGQICGYS